MKGKMSIPSPLGWTWIVFWATGIPFGLILPEDFGSNLITHFLSHWRKASKDLRAHEPVNPVFHVRKTMNENLKA